jgi:hypothetical protein
MLVAKNGGSVRLMASSQKPRAMALGEDAQFGWIVGDKPFTNEPTHPPGPSQAAHRGVSQPR